MTAGARPAHASRPRAMEQKGENMTDRTRRRIATVVLAPAAALSAWACIRLAGIDLVVSAGDVTVGAGDVMVAALMGALGGWFVVHLLERHSRRPWFWWPALGSTALAVSTVGPAYLADSTTAIALTALHFVTAIVVITGFATTLPACRDCGARMCGCLPRSDPAP
jgi:Family of unknown function (DUF6069)